MQEGLFHGEPDAPVVPFQKVHHAVDDPLRLAALVQVGQRRLQPRQRDEVVVLHALLTDELEQGVVQADCLAVGAVQYLDFVRDQQVFLAGFRLFVEAVASHGERPGFLSPLDVRHRQLQPVLVKQRVHSVENGRVSLPDGLFSRARPGRHSRFRGRRRHGLLLDRLRRTLLNNDRMALDDLFQGFG